MGKGGYLMDYMRQIVINVFGIHQKIVNDVPALSRGIVWCHECGKQQKVDSAECLQCGCPKCCDQTMSIDSPEERKKSLVAEKRRR